MANELLPVTSSPVFYGGYITKGAEPVDTKNSCMCPKRMTVEGEVDPPCNCTDTGGGAPLTTTVVTGVDANGNPITIQTMAASNNTVPDALKGVGDTVSNVTGFISNNKPLVFLVIGVVALSMFSKD